MRQLKLVTVEQLYSETIALQYRKNIRLGVNGISVGDWLAIKNKKLLDGRMRTINQLALLDEDKYVDYASREGCVTCVVRVASKAEKEIDGKKRYTFEFDVVLPTAPVPMDASFPVQNISKEDSDQIWEAIL